MINITLKASKLIYFLMVCVVLLGPVSGGSSQSQKENSKMPVIKLDTDVVTLDVQVLSKKSSNAIADLRKENFIIYENGVKQEVTHFSYGQFPLSVILLIDNSGSVYGVLNELHDASIKALKQLKPTDEVAIMAFSSTAWLVKGFTTDTKDIVESIGEGKLVPLIGADNIDFPPGGTHIADSIYLAAKQLGKASNPPGRRVIIIVTDNWANDTIHSEEEVTNQLFESGVTVYGLIMGSRSVFNRYIIPMSLGKNGGNATTYADKTGGIVLNGRNRKAVENLTKIINWIRSQYSLGYISTSPQMDGKFRKIKLKVTPEVEKREGGVTILTRQGYYARPRSSDGSVVKESAAPKKN